MRNLAAWIYPRSSSAVTYIESVFDCDVAGQYGSGWGLNNGQLKAILNSQFWSPGVPIALSNWTHVTLTFNKTTAAFYTNGVQAASLSYSQKTVTSSNYKIGKSNANPLYFHGDIDDARIYCRVLNAVEILLSYQRLPGLMVSATDSAPQISWPAWAADFSLWSSANLAPPAAWSPANGVIRFTNGYYSFSLPLTGNQLFYRLAK